VGAWGTGAFENDDAADWIYELLPSADLTPARDALAAAMDSDGWLETPEGARAVAAAAVVAAGFDGHTEGMPEDLVDWLEYHPDAGTRIDARLAMDALERVASTDSELREVWLEAAAGPAWVETIARLGYRLGRVLGDEIT
jgi:hypothetical protein